jgi:hypothetical protein
MKELAQTMRFGLDKLDMLLRMVTTDFAPEHWSARPWQGLHSAHWILAHLALSLNQEAGVQVVFNEELDKVFDYGAPVEERPETWPGVDELWTRYAEGLAALAARWEARTPEEWLKEQPENRLKMKTTADGEMFVLEHAVYHVGQLGAIRRLLGLKGMV